jgi:hypothetical protein
VLVNALSPGRVAGLIDHVGGGDLLKEFQPVLADDLLVQAACDSLVSLDADGSSPGLLAGGWEPGERGRVLGRLIARERGSRISPWTLGVSVHRPSGATPGERQFCD